MAPKALEKYEVIQILSMFKTTIMVLGSWKIEKKNNLETIHDFGKEGAWIFYH